ncbi:hypothetical protein LSUE1_G001618 [Lachnellula suecica]|uniref:Uncharacterized protein n=1 Tax=Lachnellula suecica TaxID=602035 RepID=A0A8T9CE87_9HELO|nr:hypothetical protein LSUE1_G001618 [Lachnellula suecica]
MLLPRVVVAALALRQLDSILPSDYCQPTCPSCKSNIENFDSTTACVADSPFLTNCGACQSCIITYSLTHEVPNLSGLELAMSNIVNQCADTNASAQVSGLQSQASRLSLLPTISAATSGPTASPTTTSWIDPNDPRFSSILATASWSARYASRTSASGASLASASSVAAAALADSTARAQPADIASSTTGAPTNTPTITSLSTPSPPLNKSWIVGPVAGSVLGIITVFVVIFFTRRKQRREEWELGGATPTKEFTQDFSREEDEESTSSRGREKPQLHSECIPRKELDNTELVPPVELPALEPVGMELLTPREDKENSEREWPLPISPLPALFAMTEIRDERTGWSESPRHETFYHP